MRLGYYELSSIGDGCFGAQDRFSDIHGKSETPPIPFTMVNSYIYFFSASILRLIDVVGCA